MKETRIQSVSDFLVAIKDLYSSEDYTFLEKAARKAHELHLGQNRASGEPYIIHPLQVAEILVRLRMDAITVAAALLHDTLEDTSLSREDLRIQFGEEVENLVFGVTKIEIVNEKKKNFAEAETIRKMLFAMVKDVRVILIKLADKLHNMRTLQYKTPERQKAIAQDTLDIFAPLAARLGISWMKDELEDLALKFTQSDVYQQIKSFVSFKKEERAAYLERVRLAIIDAAAEEKITIEAESRAKHFYSIYSKMKKRNKKLDEIYDLLGIRILCDHVHDCYIVLGVVHRLWMPIAGRFKDYIAMPKENKYQSLHTTVMCYEGKLIEIQIRTRTMDETAQFGVAAHWLYKQNTKGQKGKPEDISLISRLQDMNSSGMASLDFLDDIKRELLKDSIYVFTPKGDVIQLPAGSTAIDFAYHIHTEVGNHAVGAKADGTIIPLRTALKNTQVIEIITNPAARPHVDWLRFVKTAKTRHKVRTWLNHHDETIILDRNIVAKKPKSVLSAKIESAVPSTTSPPASSLDSKSIRVEGEANMMIHFANCCSPVSGDDIVGYVSRGRGIMIHRRDCRNLGSIPDRQDRSIEVEWEGISPKTIRILTIHAQKDLKLFAELDRILRRFHGHLLEGKLDSEYHGEYQQGTFTVEIGRKDALKRFLKALRAGNGILEVKDNPEHSEH